MKFVVILFILLALIFVASLIAKSFDNKGGTHKRDILLEREKLRIERQKNSILTKTMREIASDRVGLPILEAQDALEKVERLEIKELS